MTNSSAFDFKFQQSSSTKAIFSYFQGNTYGKGMPESAFMVINHPPLKKRKLQYWYACWKRAGMEGNDRQEINVLKLLFQQTPLQSFCALLRVPSSHCARVSLNIFRIPNVSPSLKTDNPCYVEKSVRDKIRFNSQNEYVQPLPLMHLLFTAHGGYFQHQQEYSASHNCSLSIGLPAVASCVLNKLMID